MLHATLHHINPHHTTPHCIALHLSAHLNVLQQRLPTHIIQNYNRNKIVPTHTQRKKGSSDIECTWMYCSRELSWDLECWCAIHPHHSAAPLLWYDSYYVMYISVVYNCYCYFCYYVCCYCVLCMSFIDVACWYSCCHTQYTI